MLKAGRTASKTALLQIKMKYLKRTIFILTICAVLILPRFCFALDWVASGNNMYYNGGNIGIGTTAPTNSVFEVHNGRVYFYSGTGTSRLTFNTDVADEPLIYNFNQATSKFGDLFLGGNNGDYYFKIASTGQSILSTNSNTPLSVYSGATSVITVKNNGLYVVGSLFLNGTEITGSGSTGTTSVSSAPWINSISAIEIRGTIGNDVVDLIVNIPFFIFLFISITSFICFFIIFKLRKHGN